MHSKDIRNTNPRIDCRWCELHNFVDFKGNHFDEQYAVCKNQVKSWGMDSIDITKEGNPLQWETNCTNCKHFESNRQLSLFDSGSI